jgi:hypothetical protein
MGKTQEDGGEAKEKEEYMDEVWRRRRKREIRDSGRNIQIKILN